MENKEKAFLETLLEKINAIAHDGNRFPEFHDYSKKGKLELFETDGMSGTQDAVQFGVKYKNGDFERNIFYPITLTSEELSNISKEDVYKTLSGNLLYMNMFGIGSLKDEIPLVSNLIIYGEHWLGKVVELKEKGFFIPYKD